MHDKLCNGNILIGFATVSHSRLIELKTAENKDKPYFTHLFAFSRRKHMAKNCEPTNET